MTVVGSWIFLPSKLRVGLEDTGPRLPAKLAQSPIRFRVLALNKPCFQIKSFNQLLCNSAEPSFPKAQPCCANRFPFSEVVIGIMVGSTRDSNAEPVIVTLVVVGNGLRR